MDTLDDRYRLGLAGSPQVMPPVGLHCLEILTYGPVSNSLLQYVKLIDHPREKAAVRACRIVVKPLNLILPRGIKDVSEKSWNQ